MKKFNFAGNIQQGGKKLLTIAKADFETLKNVLTSADVKVSKNWQVIVGMAACWMTLFIGVALGYQLYERLPFSTTILIGLADIGAIFISFLFLLKHYNWIKGNKLLIFYAIYVIMGGVLWGVFIGHAAFWFALFAPLGYPVNRVIASAVR